MVSFDFLNTQDVSKRSSDGGFVIKNSKISYVDMEGKWK